MFSRNASFFIRRESTLVVDIALLNTLAVILIGSELAVETWITSSRPVEAHEPWFNSDVRDKRN